MNNSAGKIRTIAVTGASGLLGRHLCEYFNARGWKVHALLRNNLHYPFSQRGIHVYKCDLPDTIELQSLEKVDILIHCAYMTRFTNVEDARRVNEDGTSRLYETAKAAGIKKFVFVSSMAARPNAKSYYAQSKYRLESMMDMERDLVIRPGLVLASDGGLFYRIKGQVRRLPVIPLFGGGDQEFNTIHIEDLCKIFEWALESDMCGVINAAEPDGITMKELLHAVLKQLGQNKLLVPVPGKPFVILFQLLELLRLKLPVSSENLRGLLNRDNMNVHVDKVLRQGEIKIRSARESIKDLIAKTY